MNGRRSDPWNGALHRQPLTLPAADPPILSVVVDTEEEFEWTAGFSPFNTSVRAMAHVDRGQRIFERYGIRPTYMVDYPVATQPAGYQPLLELVARGTAVIGAHLHPWVNPPHDEEVCEVNSFPCNLGESLEEAKLRELTGAIAGTFGASPTMYKAGRYGFGPSTIGILERLGFELDASINPQMDFSASGGPNFLSFDTSPFLFGRSRLLELPCTTAYVGVAGRLAPILHHIASSRPLRPARAVGVLARLGVVNKVMLSPEDNTLTEMKQLTKELLRNGTRTFSLTFHSPSLEPGHTSYVRSESDLDAFLRSIDSYCEFFFGGLRGIAMTPLELKQALLSKVEATARVA